MLLDRVDGFVLEMRESLVCKKSLCTKDRQILFSFHQKDGFERAKTKLDYVTLLNYAQPGGLSKHLVHCCFPFSLDYKSPLFRKVAQPAACSLGARLAPADFSESLHKLPLSLFL